jgi:hypothetical protein
MKEYCATMTMKFDSSGLEDSSILHALSDLNNRLMDLCPEKSFSRSNADLSQYELVFLTKSRVVRDSRIRVLSRTARMILDRRGLSPSMEWSLSEKIESSASLCLEGAF